VRTFLFSVALSGEGFHPLFDGTLIPPGIYRLTFPKMTEAKLIRMEEPYQTNV
jgi:hypothetical protein